MHQLTDHDSWHRIYRMEKTMEKIRSKSHVGLAMVVINSPVSTQQVLGNLERWTQVQKPAISSISTSMMSKNVASDCSNSNLFQFLSLRSITIINHVESLFDFDREKSTGFGC